MERTANSNKNNVLNSKRTSVIGLEGEVGRLGQPTELERLAERFRSHRDLKG